MHEAKLRGFLNFSKSRNYQCLKMGDFGAKYNSYTSPESSTCMPLESRSYFGTQLVNLEQFLHAFKENLTLKEPYADFDD